MGVGRRTDEDGPDLRVSKDGINVLGNVRDAEALDEGLSLLVEIRVGDRFDLHLTDCHADVFDVHAADTPSADDCYFHDCSPFKYW